MAKWRILIVDDEEDVRLILKASLSAKYEIVEAQDGLDALEKIELAEPDFIVLDVMMPLMDGFQTCEAIRRHPAYGHLSVLFLSALNSKDDMKRAYSAGANLYLTKPFEPSRLMRNVDLFFETSPPPQTRKRYSLEQLEEIRKAGAASIAAATSTATPAPSLLSSKPPAAAAPPPEPRPIIPVRILHVDDDPHVLAVVRGALEREFEVFQAVDGMDAIEKITTYQPDVLLIDTVMPRMSGYQLCQSLRKNSRFAQMPIVFLSGKSAPKDRDFAMRTGGTGFLAKPFDLTSLREEVVRVCSLPGFAPLPKALTASQLRDMETTRAQEEMARQQQAESKKNDSELERFLREHSG